MLCYVMLRYVTLRYVTLCYAIEMGACLKARRLIPLPSLAIYLFGYGFATYILHDVICLKTCRNKEVTQGPVSFVIFYTLDRIGYGVSVMLLCYVMLCYVMLCCCVIYSSVCCVVLCYAMLCYTIFHPLTFPNEL